MILINKSILHILDFNSGISVFSEKELDINNESVNTFLSKHIEKSVHDPNLKSGTFLSTSEFKKNTMRYISGELSFIDLSLYVINIIHSAISKSDTLNPLDVIIVDFTLDNEQFIGILMCANKVGYTHQVLKDNDKVVNQIINHYAILPNPSQKLETYAFINLITSSIEFIDKRRYIDGKDTFIIPDLLLECSSSISQRDAVKLVSSITKTIAENHGQSSVLAISKAKNYIVENTEVTERLEPLELGKEIFNFSEEMQKEFVIEAKNAGIPETVNIDKTYVIRTNKTHKIKTDTGIEISFPVDYFQNKDYIDFVNNPDGTLSIEIKNIGKIINK